MTICRLHEIFYDNERSKGCWVCELVAENKRLQAIVDKLSKTADGVVPYAGMIVYTWTGDMLSGFKVDRVDSTVESTWLEWGFHNGRAVEDCFSTREAAEAKEKSDG